MFLVYLTHLILLSSQWIGTFQVGLATYMYMCGYTLLSLFQANIFGILNMQFEQVIKMVLTVCS